MKQQIHQEKEENLKEKLFGYKIKKLTIYIQELTIWGFLDKKNIVIRITLWVTLVGFKI